MSAKKNPLQTLILNGTTPIYQLIINYEIMFIGPVLVEKIKLFVTVQC